MKSENICKFITAGNTERLSTENFIFESQTDVMKKEITLASHRALLVSSGGGKVCIDGSAFPLGTGALAFAFCGERFSFQPEQETEYFYISFSGRRAEELFRRLSLTPSRRIFHGFESFIPIWRDGIARAEESSIDLLSEGILLLTLARVGEGEREREPIAMRMVRYVEENFTDPACSLSSIASALGYNEKYLSHSFKREMGCGFSQYLRKLRLRHALFMMEHGVESIKNVACLAGFSDPLYFSSVFKESYGCAPSVYLERRAKSKES